MREDVPNFITNFLSSTFFSSPGDAVNLTSKHVISSHPIYCIPFTNSSCETYIVPGPP
jgi:hypothetical protein